MMKLDPEGRNKVSKPPPEKEMQSWQNPKLSYLRGCQNDGRGHGEPGASVEGTSAGREGREGRAGNTFLSRGKDSLLQDPACRDPSLTGRRSSNGLWGRRLSPLHGFMTRAASVLMHVSGGLQCRGKRPCSVTAGRTEGNEIFPLGHECSECHIVFGFRSGRAAADGI